MNKTQETKEQVTQVTFKQKLSDFATKASAVTLTMVVSAQTFAADYNIDSVVSEIDKGEVAVAAAASATMGLYVVRRVWKIIRGSI